ncbi:MAG: adenylyl-sulfate kinase, partial [Nitrospinaceae bacterium]|nr:adenylyl-sulfate kinase [Nitrospinaceae bacterium]NIU97073.1 adenylyl-sulfate kinase [Nitrospinaceae bacterium]NIW59654.1 adenylyl-sulfate kinase [Nitrospinaceae bacterium]
PLAICENRDRKGLYAKARAGLIKDFTGIDDPYEDPEKPDVTLDTSTMSANEAAQTLLLYLEKEGYVEKH